MIDSLTGIHNRHYFNDLFNRETDRARRHGHSICAFMIDADNFKGINDRFGHLAGDKVLQHIAGILKSSVREYDVLARFGGYERIILLPYADEKMGCELAKRIQVRIREGNKTPLLEGLELALSIGLHAATPDQLESLLADADRKLYQCKSIRND